MGEIRFELSIQKCNPVADCFSNKAGDILDSQFFHQVGTMFLDCFNTDSQLMGNP